MRQFSLIIIRNCQSEAKCNIKKIISSAHLVKIYCCEDEQSFKITNIFPDLMTSENSPFPETCKYVVAKIREQLHTSLLLLFQRSLGES